MRGAGVQSNRTVDCSSTPRGAQEVTCVAVLSNGNIVSGSSDRTLMMWDASSGECLKTLHGHTSSARRRRPAAPRVDCSSAPRRAQVLCVAALPNGNCYIVSGSWDRTLKVWDASSGECLQTLRGHTGVARRRRPVERRVDRSSTPRRAQVLCVAVLPNGRVVSGSRDNTLKVWDASSGECLQTLRGHTGVARRRRPVERRVDRSSTPRRAQVLCVAVLPNGRVVSGSDDGTLKVWVDYAKMARLVALRRLRGMNVKTAGRLIARFL